MVEGRDAKLASLPIYLCRLCTNSRAMSLLPLLKSNNPGLNNRYDVSKRPFLPDPNEKESDAAAASCKSANDEIDAQMLASGPQKKRGKYSHYDDEKRAEVARLANEHGLAAASRKFDVSTSTINTWRRNLRTVMKNPGTGPESISSLQKQPEGRPLLLLDNVLVSDISYRWIYLLSVFFASFFHKFE